MNSAIFSFGSLGPGVRGLLFASSGIFILQQFLPVEFRLFFGLVPAKVWGSGWVWQLGTYLFLHGGFFHFLFNMFTLWMFGKELESVWGTREFLKFFFICGSGAAVCNLILTPGAVFPIIGASGAIYGILMAFALMNPNAPIYLYGVFPMRAKYFVLLLGTFEFLMTLQNSGGLIAHWAHLGGLVSGFLYLKWYEIQSWGRNFFGNISLKTSSKKVRFKVMPENQEEDLEKEVNRILEKVLTQGAESLTEKEKEIMKKYSDKKSS